MTYVQLIEPDGTPNITVTLESAIEYCISHPGWSWCYCEDSE